MINIVGIKNNLDNVTFLVLLFSMLFYWVSISFPKLSMAGN